MGSRKLIVVALAGALATGMAQAGSDVQWSVSIGFPFGLPIFPPVPVIRQVPVITQPVPVVIYPAPVYWHPAPVAHYPVYQRPTPWDRDGDGVPNRYDRVYNPRWDRDGDGVPNRYDRPYRGHHDRDWHAVSGHHGDRQAHGAHR